MLSYKNLLVWQKSMDLVEEIYHLVKLLPKAETYALSDQMRRAAVSIPSNIAEGKNRHSRKEYIHFLSIARGSVSELNTQLLICNRIGYLSEDTTATAIKLCEEVGAMLYGLIQKLTPDTIHHTPDSE